jgi:hypothetical protein
LLAKIQEKKSISSSKRIRHNLFSHISPPRNRDKTLTINVYEKEGENPVGWRIDLY